MKIKRIHIFLISFAVAFILYYVLTSGVNTDSVPTKELLKKDYSKEIEKLEVYDGPFEGEKYSERIDDIYYIGNGNFLVSTGDAFKVISKDGENLSGGELLYNVSFPEYNHFSATKDADSRMYAAFNEKGERLTDYLYDEEVCFIDYNVGIVYKDFTAGIINGKGEEVLPLEYDYNVFYDIEDKRFLVTTEVGDNTIYDFNFNKLSSFKADYINDFSDGMILARKDGEMVWLDYEGNVVFEAGENNTWSSYFGDYVMKETEDDYYILNKKGETLLVFSEAFDLESITDVGEPSSNGIMPIALDERYGLYDINKKECITGYIYDYLVTFDENDYIAAELDGVYGLIDDQGNTIFDFKYYVISNYSKEGTAVCIDDDWVIIDENEKPISKFRYDIDVLDSVRDGYSECISGDYYGVISLESGKVLLGDVSPRKGEVHSYDNSQSENLIVVETNENDFGVIDKKGNVVIPFDYINIEILNDNLFYAEDDDGNQLLINSENKIVQKFEDVVYLEKDPDGKHIAIFNADEKKGYMDENGKIIIDIDYSDIGDFSEIMAVSDGDEFAFINSKGETINDETYYYAENFVNGRAVIANDDFYYGYIDSNGNQVIDYKYYDAGSFTEKGVAWVELEYRKFAIIDLNGNVIKGDIEADYIQNTPFADRFVITVNEKTGLINEKGEFVVEPKYDLIEFSTLTRKEDPTSLDYIIVSTNNLEGIINKDGKVIIEPKYEYVSYFTNDLVKIRVDDKYEFLDTTGNVVINPDYVLVSYFMNDRAIAYKNYDGEHNEGYIIDKTGKNISDISKYATVYPFKNGTCIAEEKEETYLLNTEGEVIYPKQDN